MTKKKRLVDFDDDANTNTDTSNDISTKNDTDNNVNMHTDINNDMSVSQLLKEITSRTSKPKKIQRIIYLSEGISKKFDRYGKKV